MNKGIKKIFSEVPRTYELVNHILTFGLDIWWRKKAVRYAAGLGGCRWIDMCSGTGETAVYLNRRSHKNVEVFATDFSLPMLSVAASKPDGKRIRFILSDIKELPFRDDSFDLVTISFATRNINLNREVLVQTLTEFHRVLKPGGSFINLETSQPTNPLIRFLFHLYVRLLIKPVGSVISGSKAGYAYLANTIPRFYVAEEFKTIISEAGFIKVKFRRLFLGISAIHHGVKR